MNGRPQGATADLTVAGGSTPPATVPVWGRFVRVFHWGLVSLFALAYLTGDEVENVHIAAGYTIAGLIVLRILWGIVGPRTARFSDFVRPPRETLAYARDVWRGRARRHLGHNPAGAVMIVALLVALGGTAATGIMMTTDAFWGSAWVEEVHELAANGSIVLASLHVLGVLVASFQHRENLVAAMWSGRKRPE